MKIKNSLFKNTVNIHANILEVTRWMIDNKELGNFLKYFDKNEYNKKFSIYNMGEIPIKQRDREE